MASFPNELQDEWKALLFRLGVGRPGGLKTILVNIAIIRTFVKLRKILASHSELSRKLSELERKYDNQFRVVFDAIRQLMAVPETSSKPIGFRSKAVKK